MSVHTGELPDFSFNYSLEGLTKKNQYGSGGGPAKKNYGSGGGISNLPFGSLMPERQYAGTEYRYGFNGKEVDDEVNGSGAFVDYGFRVHDPRLGRFLSVDPLAPKYPFYTPYQYAGNTPVWAIDVDGLEDLRYTERFLQLSGQFWNLITNSSYLMGVYNSVSDPQKREEFVVYFSIKAKNGKFTANWREKGHTQDITAYVNNLIYYTEHAETDKDWQEISRIEEMMHDLGLKPNELINEYKANPNRKFIIIALIEDNPRDLANDSKTLAHEVVAHLVDILNGNTTSGVEDHVLYTGIPEGSKDFKKYRMSEGYTPKEEYFREGSPGKVINSEIDKVIQEVSSDENE